MKKLALFAPTVALAAACSGSSVSMQPGQWELTTRVTDFQAPGAPAQMLEQMRTSAAQPQVTNECLTPEQAANPGRWMTNPGGTSANCTFTDQTFAGGVINISSSCPLPNNGGSTHTTLQGTYTATTMEARLSAQLQAGPGAPPGMPRTISTTGTLTARRTGDCPAGR